MRFSFLFTLGGQYLLETKLGTSRYASYRDMVANGVGIAGATVVIVW